MAESALKINDEYCQSIGQYFEDEGNEIQKFLDEYVSVLTTIKRKAIKRGDVACALDSYILYATKTKTQIIDLAKLMHEQTNKFLENIDEADQYIF